MKALDKVRNKMIFWIIICLVSMIIFLFFRDESKPAEYTTLGFSIICLLIFMFNLFRYIKFSKQIKTNKVYEGVIVNHVRVLKGLSYLTVKTGDKEIDTHALYNNLYSDRFVGKKVKYVLIDRTAVIIEEIYDNLIKDENELII